MKKYRARSYSKDEIDNSLAYLNRQLDLLLDSRKQTTSDINKIRKDIQFWESIDERQLKMF